MAGGTYYDVVYDKHEDILYNGTPEDTVRWLTKTIPLSSWRVVRGIDLMSVSVDAYLLADKERKEQAQEKKRQKVSDLVAKAMVKQDSATHHQDTSLVAGVHDEIVNEIMALFTK